MKVTIPQTKFITACLVFGLGLSMLGPIAPAQAITIYEGACGGDSGNGQTQGGSGSGGANSSGTNDGSGGSICDAAQKDNVQDFVKNTVNVALMVLGMVAVIMIVIGGIRYTTSNGDSSSMKGAKDTILYAVVGLVIAILAYAIVNFVLGAFS